MYYSVTAGGGLAQFKAEKSSSVCHTMMAKLRDALLSLEDDRVHAIYKRVSRVLTDHGAAC